MLRQKESKKLLKWSEKDVISNVATYLANAIVLFGIFILFVYLNAVGGGQAVGEYFKEAKRLIQFVVLMLLLIGITALYLYLEDRDFLKNAANSEMLFLAAEVSLIVGYIVGKYVDVYLRPLALGALLALFLSNKRNAIFIGAISSILMFLMDLYAGTLSGIEVYSSLIVGFSSSVVAVFCMNKVYSRFKIMALSFVLSAPALLCVLMLLIENDFNDWLSSLVSCVFSGPMAAALLLIFLPIFEFLFQKVSCFKLAELNDHKAKLIKRLIKEAPGTFNHSLVVANIAEACATAIEEDGLLARTCAYYHDIGKLRRPEFFSENQADGVNPHNELTPELSATIIRSHTQDGYNLLLKNRYPQEIADVALEHHGTLPIWYFYDKAKKFTDGEVDINQFSYTGPKPQSKIAAIIMIADGCEAASRTLKERSREKVTEVVRKIVNERMELGQFDECEITIKELNIIIQTVVNSLTGVYHKRVKYPKVSLDGIKENGKDEIK